MLKKTKTVKLGSNAGIRLGGLEDWVNTHCDIPQRPHSLSQDFSPSESLMDILPPSLVENSLTV